MSGIFKQIADLGIVNFSMNVLQKGEKVSVIFSVKANDTKSSIKPILINFDSFEELDEKLVEAIQTPLVKINDFNNNVDAVVESVDKAEKPKTPAKKAPAKKADAKTPTPPPAPEKAPEPDLFSQEQTEVPKPTADTSNGNESGQAVQTEQAPPPPVSTPTPPTPPSVPEERVEPTTEPTPAPAAPVFEEAKVEPVDSTPVVPTPVAEEKPKSFDAIADDDDPFAGMGELFGN